MKKMDEQIMFFHRFVLIIDVRWLKNIICYIPDKYVVVVEEVDSFFILVFIIEI